MEPSAPQVGPSSLSTLNAEKNVAPLLKTQETQLKSSIPSFLQEAAPSSSPSSLFSDYIKTGDPALKQQAGDAYTALSNFASKAQATASDLTSKGQSMFSDYKKFVTRPDSALSGLAHPMLTDASGKMTPNPAFVNAIGGFVGGEGGAAKDITQAVSKEAAPIFKGAANLSTRILEAVPMKEGDFFYHGAKSPEDVASIVKNGPNAKLSTSVIEPEAPDAFYAAKGELGKKDASMYGSNYVKVVPKVASDINVLPVSSKTWADIYGPSRSSSESVAARAKLKSMGYDAVDYGNELEILNPSKFKYIADNKSNNSKGFTTPRTLFTGAAATAGLAAAAPAAASIFNKVKGETVYDAPYTTLHPVNDDLLARIKDREGARPDQVVHNTDGSKDYGAYQINSSMLPFVHKEFKRLGKSFNAFDENDSKLAAQLILSDNYQRFRKAVGRPPNQSELMSSYNVGVTNAIKQAKEKIQGKKADQYVRASIFHG